MPKRQTEDPAEFMRRRMGHQNDQDRTNGPSGHSDPMTPGASGKTEPTKHDGQLNGQAQHGKGKTPPMGQRTPASKARGSAKRTSKPLPNTGKAKSMVKGSPKGTPSKESIGRYLNRAVGKPPTNPREGILSHFEGFRGGGKQS